MKNFFFLQIVVGLILVQSCKPKNDNPDQPNPIDTTSGKHALFITNEGSFGSANGSITMYNTKDKNVYNNYFSNANGRPLGDVVQSMAISQGRGYIVVNNSNKVEVVNLSDFKSVFTINGLSMPRYFAASGEKGFISEWVSYNSNGRVAVVDTKTNTITNAIPVGTYPEQLLELDGKIFVANSGDSTISVISSASLTIINTVKVGYSPSNIVKDQYENIWVLCGGKREYNNDWTINAELSKPGSLVKMSGAGEIIQKLDFPSTAVFPSNLCIDGNTLYYNFNGKTFSMYTAANSLPTTALINRSFYGLGVDPVEKVIYGGKAMTFTSDDYVIRFTGSGAILDSFRVGIAPNNFTFYK